MSENKLELIEIPEDTKNLQFLYGTVPGRFFLKILTARWISVVAGKYLDSSLSRGMINNFAKKNGIDLSEYEDVKHKNFNSFFSRKIKSGLRPYDMDQSYFACPCDGLLSVYRINKDLIMPVKQSEYSVSDLLKDKELAARYDGGTCLVYRLCVNHYHRYSFAETGTILSHKKIKGRLHTVRPIALRARPVFSENAREYDVIKTENFGTIVQMEVGAMLVGKIKNYQDSGNVQRGCEKGTFLFGGSTIIVLLEKDSLNLPESYFKAREDGYEISVKMGQPLI